MTPTVRDANVLAMEVETYEANKEKLLEHHTGRFVLVHGDKIVGIFDHAKDAYRAGVQRFGNEPMLIQQIQRVDPVESIPAWTLGLLGTSN